MKIRRTCPVCGKEFETYASLNPGGHCSRTCGYKSIKRHIGRRVPLVKTICPQCGEEFAHERWKHQKFCSVQCGVDFQKGITVEKKTCPECGKEFKRAPWKHQKFCSFRCGVDYNRGKPRRSRAKSRPKNRTRNRPQLRTRDGRKITIYRLVMEEHVGRRLLSSETVHHIDFDIHNNELSNLYLYSNESEHITGHHSLERIAKILLERDVVVFIDGAYRINQGSGKGGGSNRK